MQIFLQCNGTINGKCRRLRALNCAHSIPHKQITDNWMRRSCRAGFYCSYMGSYGGTARCLIVEKRI